MAAYWVSIYQEIRDEQKMAAYAALARPALTSASGRFIARDLPEKVYEGGLNQRVVIIEFDSVEAATAAHDSPAYQEALEAGDGERSARSYSSNNVIERKYRSIGPRWASNR